MFIICSCVTHPCNRPRRVLGILSNVDQSTWCLWPPTLIITLRLSLRPADRQPGVSISLQDRSSVVYVGEWWESYNAEAAFAVVIMLVCSGKWRLLPSNEAGLVFPSHDVIVILEVVLGWRTGNGECRNLWVSLLIRSRFWCISSNFDDGSDTLKQTKVIERQNILRNCWNSFSRLDEVYL